MLEGQSTLFYSFLFFSILCIPKSQLCSRGSAKKSFHSDKSEIKASLFIYNQLNNTKDSITTIPRVEQDLGVWTWRNFTPSSHRLHHCPSSITRPREMRRGLLLILWLVWLICLFGWRGGGWWPSMNDESSEQILWTRAESQQIVTARSLYCLQYPVRTKSSTKDLPQWRMELSCLAPTQVLWTQAGEPTDMLLHSEKPNVFLVGWHHWEKWPRT
jgi:hypothetical protein